MAQAQGQVLRMNSLSFWPWNLKDDKTLKAGSIQCSPRKGYNGGSHTGLYPGTPGSLTEPQRQCGGWRGWGAGALAEP